MIPAQFNAKEVEQKWYDYWMKNDYFSSKPDHRTPYTIVIPPPNVTGVLHMGHMLNNTIQDVLIRRARLKGFNACWVPGTDHASIATEAKVVAKLKSEGINKNDLTREEFLKHAWDWTNKYGGPILEQLKQLGCSCDWNRTKFTMDEDMSASVIHSFVDLYNKGLIYRGYRMVNWDPEAKTTLSDEEVIFEDANHVFSFLLNTLHIPSKRILVSGSFLRRRSMICLLPSAISSGVWPPMLLVPIITTAALGLMPSISPWSSLQSTCSVPSPPMPRFTALRRS